MNPGLLDAGTAALDEYNQQDNEQNARRNSNNGDTVHVDLPSSQNSFVVCILTKAPDCKKTRWPTEENADIQGGADPSATPPIIRMLGYLTRVRRR